MTQTLIRCSDYAPTSLDRKGVGTPEQREHWYIYPASVVRDDTLAARRKLLNAETWLAKRKIPHELLRFNHWAVGWFEIIIFDGRNGALEKVSKRTGVPCCEDCT